MSSSPPSDDGLEHPSPFHKPPSRSNWLVIGTGALLLVASAAVLTHLFTARSRDAVVEADVIDLATPITGELQSLSVDVGASVGAGQSLGLVESTRVDASDVERLRTALITSESDLQRTNRELDLLNQQLKDYARDAKDQRRLELDRLNNQLAELAAELEREQQEVSYSERDLQRQNDLFKAGAIAERVVDRARTSLVQNRQQLAGIKARIGATTSQRQAAERDLSLDRTRGNIDPTPRLQETKLRQQLLDSQKSTQQKRIAGLQAELRAAEQLLQKRRQAVIKAPRAGVVWRLLARPGDDLRAQQKVIRMVDCKRRWIITTVNESTLNRLRIGSPASIDLAGERLNLNGRIDLIRSGIDRLSGDVNDDPKPLQRNQKALSQVRVQILNDVPAPAANLCFIGYGAKVLFR